MKKVLICYTSIGSGHRVAAESIRDALMPYKSIDVKLLDAMQPVQLKSGIVSELSSLFSFSVAPKAYDWAWQSGSLQKLYEMICDMEILYDYIFSVFDAYTPDLIICTHSLPCSVFSKAKANGKISTPIIAVATDFQVHPYWPVQDISQFVVGSEVARNKLLIEGMNADQILVFGIPISPKFDLYVNKEITNSSREMRKYLILAGSSQSMSYMTLWPKIVRIVRNTSLMTQDIHWTIIAGKSSALKRYLKKTVNKYTNVEVVGYVENMADQISEAEVVFTKPGGLILAECLSLCKPIVLFTRGAGQERANAQYLLERNSALILNREFKYLPIEKILTSEKLCVLSQNARNLAYPSASSKIAQFIANSFHESMWWI